MMQAIPPGLITGSAFFLPYYNIFFTKIKLMFEFFSQIIDKELMFVYNSVNKGTNVLLWRRFYEKKVCIEEQEEIHIIHFLHNLHNAYNLVCRKRTGI